MDWQIQNVILPNLARVKLWDTVRGADLNLERKLLFETRFDNIVVAIFGCGTETYAPYYDVIMELAYNIGSRNLNCVIVNKGDNSLEISVDGKVIAQTEQIMGEIFYHDQTARVRGKWAAFNFRNLVLPEPAQTLSWLKNVRLRLHFPNEIGGPQDRIPDQHDEWSKLLFYRVSDANYFNALIGIANMKYSEGNFVFDRGDPIWNDNIIIINYAIGPNIKNLTRPIFFMDFNFASGGMKIELFWTDKHGERLLYTYDGVPMGKRTVYIEYDPVENEVIKVE